jgi:hypothetical protein
LLPLPSLLLFDDRIEVFYLRIPIFLFSIIFSNSFYGNVKPKAITNSRPTPIEVTLFPSR